MSRIPALRKLPLIVAGLYATTFASSVVAAPLQAEVRDAQGKLLSNTMVWVVTPAGAEVAKTTTDAKGIARFADIAPGKYLVEIRGTRGLALTKPVDISGTALVSAAIAMDAAPAAAPAPAAAKA
ncbi:MAG TPA: carboxypeptidase-like regulatory domain-containing protein, partial [Burkholderiaceae bacterium]